MEKKKIEVEQKVHTRYKTERVKADDGFIEDERETAKVEVDKRHYCSVCGRKRDERFMEEFGKGAYGKSRWRCIDDEKACLEIKSLKEAL